MFDGGGLLDFGQRFFAGLQDAGSALNGGQGNAFNQLMQRRALAQRLAQAGATPASATPQVQKNDASMGGGGLLDFGHRLFSGLQAAGDALSAAPPRLASIPAMRARQMASANIDMPAAQDYQTRQPDQLSPLQRYLASSISGYRNPFA